MIAMMPWLLGIPLLGAATGLRTFTPIAAICWAAYLGYLPVDGSWATWTTHLVAAILFTLLALGEYVGDKLPRTPNRTAPGPLAARVLFGALCGAICAATLGRPGPEGVLLGAIGAVAGAYAGFFIRRGIVLRLESADWPVAVVEDVTAILAALFALHMITG